MFKTQYRVSRDRFSASRYVVQSKRWWWPFWLEEVGMLESKEDALQTIDDLKNWL